MKLVHIILASTMPFVGCSGLLTPVNQKPPKEQITSTKSGERIITTHTEQGKEIIYQKPERLRDEIGYNNIVLKNFEDLDDNIPSYEILLPSDLEKVLSEKKYEIRDKEKFESQVYSEAKKLGFTKQDIKKLKPKQAIQLIADIIKQRFSYSTKYNKDHTKTVDDLFVDEKIAECSMYSFSAIAIHNIFKKINSNLTNVYITTSRPLTRAEEHIHEWNPIFIYDGKTLQIANIDITFYEHEPTISATGPYYIDKAWRAVFYKKLKDYKAVIKESQRLIKEYKYDKELQSDLLYLIYDSALKLDNKELEKQSYNILLEKYPTSMWSISLKKDKK